MPSAASFRDAPRTASFRDAPRASRARWWFHQVHVWAGVVAALYVIVSCLTGSAMMFRQELTALATATPRARIEAGEAPVSAQAALEALEALEALDVMSGAMPPARLASLQPPVEDGLPYHGVLVGNGQYVVAEVNPVTGVVTGLVTRQNSTWRFIEDLHNNLLTGRSGRVANGVGGIAVAVLCLTGIVIWWQGRARWRRGLTVAWRARWPRLLWDLHGAMGIWFLPITFVIAVSGVYFTWPAVFRSAVALVTPVPAPSAPLRFEEAANRPRASADRLIAAAAAAVPGQRVFALQLPGDPRQAVRAQMTRGGHDIAAHRDAVLLHPVEARVVGLERHADRPLGDRIVRWIGPLHGGHFAGRVSQTLWFVAGLVMAGLAGTGLVLWWNRVVRRLPGAEARAPGLDQEVADGGRGTVVSHLRSSPGRGLEFS
ncbi:MAG: PepSY domain-containing protein [Acidobacteria bacterium]|nr:PepSY domain-containing protein [Acidobacteriota bacterium]